MDRTIPPGIPEGEDAGAVVGVVAQDSRGRNSTGSRVNPDSTRRADIRDKVVLADRTGVPGADREHVLEARVARSSAGRAR